MEQYIFAYFLGFVSALLVIIVGKWLSTPARKAPAHRRERGYSRGRRW